MKIILDRIVSDEYGKRIAVFEIENDFRNVHEDNMPPELINKIKAGDIVDAEIRGNVISSAIILTSETEQKEKEMKTRLNSLFSRNKK